MGETAVSPDPIRVFLLDDHELVRRGLTDLLSSTPDLVVVGEAATCAEALNRIPAAAPHVALLDARLPDGSGIDVGRELRSAHPEVACVILTSYDDDEALFAAVMAGASGYLLKQIRGPSLVDGIRQVAAGRSLLDPAVTKKLLDRLREPAPVDAVARSLTAREREILDLIAEGCTKPGDRTTVVPRGEDGQELRVGPAGQARHATAYAGRGLRIPAATAHRCALSLSIRPELGRWVGDSRPAHPGLCAVALDDGRVV